MATAAIPIAPVLRVVPPAAYEANLQKQDAEHAKSQQPKQDDMTGLAGYIRTQFDMMKRHRANAEAGWDNRMLAALRAFNGKYSADQLAEIKKFGGSETYARVIAMKCRGATSLLRDVYLSPDKPWGLDPPADPEIPEQITQAIQQLIQTELATLQQANQPADPGMIRDRALQLMQAARDAAKKQAAKRARIAEDKLEEILEEGGFYKALADFLVYLPYMPFACIKGPEVRIVPEVSYQNSQAAVQNKPKLFWRAPSPFDIWWTPGVEQIEDASIIERTRLTRADLNDLLDLPGYNEDAVRQVLDAYGRGGISDDWDQTDSERAVNENRENPRFNQSGLITCLEFHGNVQGRMLLEQGGFDKKQIPDPLRDYFVQAWLIGRWVIKVQLSPSPRKRHPYYITSYEKTPGSPAGNALPDILSDIQDVENATIRSLVNNLSISSGPQVVVNRDRLAPGENGEDLYPWKRWQVQSDPMANNTQPAISFFQPVINSQELITVFNTFSQIADDLSGIPKYLAGGAAGGAGRTASGLAMLMGNASKLLQTVAANIDRDVFDPLLHGLYDMVMLTDQSGLLTGDEDIKVMGVTVAVQRETQRARQIEFLTATANPIDSQIMGPKGRATVLRAVSHTLGLPGEEIVPSEEELEAAQNAQAQAGAQGAPPQPGSPAEAGAQAQGQQQGPPSSGDMGPRTNLTSQAQPAQISGGVH